MSIYIYTVVNTIHEIVIPYLQGCQLNYPTNDDWDAWGICENLHKFFFLRWHEIFNETTFDSWQVRSCNLNIILDEMIEVIEAANDVPVALVNVTHLINEAIEYINDDKFLNKNYPYVKSYLKRLENGFNKLNKEESNNSLNGEAKSLAKINEIKSLVHVIKGNISGYKNKVVNKIEKLIQSPPENHYQQELYSLTMNLGIELKSLGYSFNALRSSIDVLKDKQIGVFYLRFKRLIEIFSGGEKNFTCLFLISWPGDIPNFDKYGINFSTKRPQFESLSPEEVAFYGQDSTAKIASIKVKSMDKYAARVDAERSIQFLLDIATLYMPNKWANIKHKKALVISDENFIKECTAPDSLPRHIRETRNTLYNIEGLKELISNMHDEDVFKITASLQYYRLALVAPTEEAILVNLWIAVESLIQHGGKNIIDRITKYISSSLSTSYIYLMIKSIPIELKHKWKKLETSALRNQIKMQLVERGYVSKSSKYMLSPFDLYNIVVDKQHGPLITSFLELVSDNPLLIYRVGYLLNEKYFKDNKSIHKRILKHYNNVQWQIRRIYRARNSLMHKGSCSQQIRPLLQHLQSYYVGTMNNLIHDLTKNPQWSINNALDNRYYLYDHYLSSIKENKIEKFDLSLFNPHQILFNPSKKEEKV